MNISKHLISVLWEGYNTCYEAYDREKYEDAVFYISIFKELKREIEYISLSFEKSEEMNHRFFQPFKDVSAEMDKLEGYVNHNLISEKMACFLID